MKKLNMAQKAKKAGLPAQTVYNRMHNGWTQKKALSVPNRNYKKKTVAYKVEPKKVQASGSRVKKPIIPLPIEKYSAPKNDNGMYIAIGLVALALVLVVAIAQN